MNEKLTLIEMPAEAISAEQAACCGEDAEQESGLAIGCCNLPPSLRLDKEQAADLSAMFKALGHPVRLQIVALLSRYGGQVCVCDIESQFDLSQPTISHHLKTLRKAGLIDCEQKGLWVYYFTRPEAVGALQELAVTLAPTMQA